VKTRKLTAVHVYSKVHFTDKVKPVIERRWKAKYLAENPQHKPTDPIPHWKIEFQNQVLHELWNAESEDVREEIRRRCSETIDECEEDDAEEETGAERAERERVARARNYQR
jgi:hypothetical protein